MALRKVRFEGVGSRCLAGYPGGKGSGKTTPQASQSGDQYSIQHTPTLPISSIALICC
ncbi:unnamed protein product [Penicillium camemberti]|uniref:Str. FM013 n=1 Tax=Penicillium camemberti (strain FM 013) TaxID=1429867 RepID=A0A0G4PPK2_PENC3|nr:unnamed protein product [Penicillium camemberti]